MDIQQNTGLCPVRSSTLQTQMDHTLIPLMLSTVREDGTCSRKHFEWLYKQLNKPHFFDPKWTDSEGNTALHLVIERFPFSGEDTDDLAVNLTQRLLELDCSVNAQNTAENTPLHCAAMRLGSCKVVTCLIEQQADENLKNKEGKSPLRIAADHDNLPFMELLRGHTPYHIAAFRGDTRDLQIAEKEELLVRNHLGENVLHAACRGGYPDTVALVLSKLGDQADTVRGEFGRPIDVARRCYNEHESTPPQDYGAVLRKLYWRRRFLDPYKPGFTELHRLCRNGEDITDYLRRHGGAEVNIQCYSGGTPFHEACIQGDFGNIAKLSAVQGIRSGIQDVLGSTPIDWFLADG